MTVPTEQKSVSVFTSDPNAVDSLRLPCPNGQLQVGGLCKIHCRLTKDGVVTEPYATAGSSLTSAGWTPVRSATFSGTECEASHSQVQVIDEQNKLECQLQAIAVCCTPQNGVTQGGLLFQKRIIKAPLEPKSHVVRDVAQMI